MPHDQDLHRYQRVASRRGVYSRAMPGTDAALEIDSGGQAPAALRVRASGAWTFNGLKERRDEILRRLAQIEKEPSERIAWDLSAVSALDDAGAVWLANATRGNPRV